MRKVNIVVLGSIKSGKTSLLKQLTKASKHTENYIDVDGFQFFSSFSDGVKLNFCELPKWNNDTTSAYKLTADYAIYCVDLSKTVDLKTINNELEEFQQLNPNARIVTVGTFSDKCKTTLRDIDFSTSSSLNFGITELHKTLIDWANADLPHNDYDLSPLDNALQLLSPLTKQDILSYATGIYEQLKVINQQINDDKKEEFGKKAYEMISVLKDLTTQPYEKNYAIQSFELYCKTSLFSSPSKALILGKLIATFIATVIIASIAGMIGFGIGLALGSWAGPAAFFSAVITGSAAAMSVASVGLGAGGISGALIGHSLFKPTTEQKLVSDLVTLAKNSISNTPSNSDADVNIDVAAILDYVEIKPEYTDRFHTDFSY